MTGGLGPSFDPDRIAAMRARSGTPYPGTPGAAPPGSKPVPRAGNLTAVKQLWLRAGVLITGFVLLLYTIEGVDAIDSRQLDRGGIEPREADGLWGVLWAPLLHSGWDHLIGNTLPVLVLGFLVLAAGIGRGLAATAVIWVLAGLGTWLTGADGSVHVGASSLVFGWLTFLILRGWFTKQVGQIVLGLVVLVLYGSLLWGVLPGQDGISWQGHLFGAIGGVVAAWLLAPRQRRSPERAAV
ncbi:rhomboid family intramembrane serine protease [Nocardia lijiangensis]|uniref:rhomboid family intramembrane serine protease n=1 Tax=Nocardia lijiangensis TaxID=299618 RepID=UPI003D72B01B